ncbi:FadR/GntR family transcriptional regulator [Desulfuromonas sp.]|uniref:FadR/GntR family transcriptional regulator n=1 Tax=Desulfuromonas sp. TaxID=892 RepID=UPI0025B7B256|nr:FadR/GntR family transcriptional regulator [Desulfuromonas sp.]
MTKLFKPIRPKKISEEIVEQIKGLISKGQLKPGDRVPSERDLASLFGVSRPSVREALMVLDAMGLVESRQGGGTFVRSLTEASLADPLTTMVEKNPHMLQALVEVRKGLECWSAYLAATRATEEEIAELGRIFNEMKDQAASGGWDPKIDSKFHYVITNATHNTIQLHLLNTIHGLFDATIHVALTEFYSREGYLKPLLDQHRDIYDAIAHRDPEESRTKMREHLEFVEEKMRILEAESLKDL